MNDAIPTTATPRDPSGGVVYVRTPIAARLNAWRKRTALNPYWLELVHLRGAVERLSSHASGTMLDVGCGERPWGSVFAGKVKRYLGLEYPPVADNLSPGIWSALHRLRGVVDVFGDGGRLPFRDESCDTLLAVEVLEHVPDPARCAAEFARVLRPGGKLLITVPFSAPRHQLPFDFARFTPEGIRGLLERNGFAIELFEARGNGAIATGAMLSHFFLRNFGARGVQSDGSVQLSRWRAPLVLPFVALSQLTFAFFARFTHDTSLSLGYAIVAKKR